MSLSDLQEKARGSRQKAATPRRAQLIEVASECFAEHGYDRVTVELITEALGSSRGTFYSYFRSKEEIFQAATELTCKEFLDSQHVEGPAREDLHTVLRMTTDAMARAVFHHAAMLEVIKARAKSDPAIGEIWGKTDQRIRHRYTAFVDKIFQATGHRSAVPSAILADTLTDAVFEGAARVSTRSEKEQQSFIDHLVTIGEMLTGFTES